jgi:hypothetical protein
MTIAVLIAIGATVGLFIGRVIERGHMIQRDIEAMRTYRALQCVHQENAGLTSQTRAIVMDAIAAHEARFGPHPPRPVPHGSLGDGAARDQTARRAQHPTSRATGSR